MKLLIPIAVFAVVVGCSLPPEADYAARANDIWGKYSALAKQNAEREVAARTKGMPDPRELQERLEAGKRDLAELERLKKQLDEIVPPESMAAFHESFSAGLETTQTHWKRLAKARENRDDKEVAKMAREAGQTLQQLGNNMVEMAKSHGLQWKAPDLGKL
ncbi:MAG: hypothetical protein ACOYON_03055 [Fimbriimonas sp.]